MRDTSEEAIKKRNFRIQRRIDQIPKRPGFKHWITMINSAKRWMVEDSWWATQIGLAKKLWRQDLIENSNRHRS